MDRIKLLPLDRIHRDNGGKMIEYAGWSLPERFSNSIEEHLAVRERAGLFDATHMGAATLKGERATEFLQRMIVGNAEQLGDGQSMYSLMCYPDGGLLDDLYVYRFTGKSYLLTFNTMNAYISFQWLLQNPLEGALLADESNNRTILALHGPAAETILQKLTPARLAQLQLDHFISDVQINNCNCLLSRAGYCGEDGFEIFSAISDAPALWQGILTAGEPQGLLPIGLGARESLRLEACSPLYGHELVPDVNPVAIGLGGLISFEKPDFIGRAAIIEALAVGAPRRLAGLIMDGQGIPRNGFPVEWSGRDIGWVTSGGYAPTLQKNVGLALIETDRAQKGEKVDVVIRDQRIPATVTDIPFI